VSNVRVKAFEATKKEEKKPLSSLKRPKSKGDEDNINKAPDTSKKRKVGKGTQADAMSIATRAAGLAYYVGAHVSAAGGLYYYSCPASLRH
jgi:hypothetical protein